MAIAIDFGTVVTGAKIITLPLAKMNSNIDFTDEDELLQLFVDAATAEIENYLGVPVLERENVTVTVTSWKTAIPLPIPFTSVTVVNTIDEAGVVTPLNSDQWDLFQNEVSLDLEMPSNFKRLEIIGTAGYANEDVPADIKKAALLIFSNTETYRENMPIKLNTSAQSILRPYKKY